ncbi:MAG TPA: 50S ribosomal protein L25 [Firmicutes bacterium]|nr:50S ribosomal protein L25 [Bacillota bacterium]
MSMLTIKASPRTGRGKEAAKKLRAAGMVPAVLYGGAVETQLLAVEAKALSKLISQGAASHLVQLETAAGSLPVLLKEVSRDPLSGRLVHVDFYQVAMDRKLRTVVPVVLTGEGQRAADGGVVVHTAREVEVECLPAQIPDRLEADISKLAIGESLKAADLVLPEGVELVSDPDTVIASITTPASEEELEAQTEEQVAEPELVGKEKDEDEE